MSATLAHAEDMRRRTEPQGGRHKEEATEPHATRHNARQEGYLVGQQQAVRPMAITRSKRLHTLGQCLHFASRSFHEQ